MLHILFQIVLYWYVIGLVCTVGWQVWTFKLKLFSELRYRPLFIFKYTLYMSLFGPIAFFIGAWGDALHKSS